MAKRINNDLHNSTQKTKDWATKTSLKTGGKFRCYERVRSSCSTSGTRRVTLVTKPMLSHDEERTGLWLR